MNNLITYIELHGWAAYEFQGMIVAYDHVSNVINVLQPSAKAVRHWLGY